MARQFTKTLSQRQLLLEARLDTITWVLGANVLIWSILGLYVAFVARRQQKLKMQLQQIETLAHDHELN